MFLVINLSRVNKENKKNTDNHLIVGVFEMLLKKLLLVHGQ